MTNPERQSRQLWAEIVMLRDPYCILYPSEKSVDPHHIYLKSQGDWKIWMDTDFGVGVSQAAHDLAHKHPEEFFDKIINRLPRDRQQKILKHKNRPKKPQIEKPDWKLIRASLRQERKLLITTSWMDDY